MREGLVVSLAQSSREPTEVARIYASALAWGIGTGAVISLGIAVLYAAGVLGHHFLWVGAISFLSIVNEILININRDQNNLKKIALLEVVYHGISVGVALWMWKELTISAGLAVLAAGLLVTVTIYLITLPELHMQDVAGRVVRKLLAQGMLLAILSAVTLMVNSLFVVLANWMALGDSIGLIVVGNNLCTIVLFGINAVAWGSVSRSLRSSYIGHSSSDEQFRAKRLRSFFRFGVVISALLCLATQGLFSVALKDYAGAEVFALYFCLFQSYGLLLFDEINYLSVTARTRWIIAGYVSLIALILAASQLFPQASIVTLTIIGIMGHFSLALLANLYCKSHIADRKIDRVKIAFLCFPVVCALLHAHFGVLGAAVTCLFFTGLELRSLLTRASA